MLEIFVHHSIKYPGMPLNADSPYGDGKRLAAIGGKALEAAYTLIFFNKRPMLSVEALEVCFLKPTGLDTPSECERASPK